MRLKPSTGLAPALLLGMLALAGCNESTAKSEAQPNRETLTADARKATEARLRTDLRGSLAFQDVAGYTQAVPETVAVCGRLVLNNGPATPFVALVSRQADGALTVEPHVATDNVSATRVYVETRSRCVADAAVMPGQRRGAPPPLPVIPARLNTITPDAPPEVKRIEAEATRAQQALPAATLRQNGNLRENPNGGGTVLRVLPRGSTLRVFAEAPGGWLQVGQDQAEGWVHGSMVSRAAMPETAGTLTTASR